MPAAPNCYSKSSLRARRKPRSPAPPMPPSPNGAPPSPTPGSPLPSSTGSPSTLTSSRPARGRTGSTPPTKPGTEPVNSAVNTGERQPNQGAGWGQIKTGRFQRTSQRPTVGGGCDGTVPNDACGSCADGETGSVRSVDRARSEQSRGVPDRRDQSQDRDTLETRANDPKHGGRGGALSGSAHPDAAEAASSVLVVGRADSDRRPAAGEAHRARDRARVGSFPGDDQQGASAQRRRSRPLSAPQRGPGRDRTHRTAACPTRDGRYRTAGRGGGPAGQAVESGTGRARTARTARRPACPASMHRVDLPGDLRPRRASNPPSQAPQATPAASRPRPGTTRPARRDDDDRRPSGRGGRPNPGRALGGRLHHGSREPVSDRHSRRAAHPLPDSHPRPDRQTDRRSNA